MLHCTRRVLLRRGYGIAAFRNVRHRNLGHSVVQVVTITTFDLVQTHLHSLLIMLEDLLRLDQIAIQVVCYSEADPILPQVWPKSEKRMACFHEARVQS